MSLDRPVSPDPYELLPAVPSFTVTSDDVTDGRAAQGRPGRRRAATPRRSCRWSGAPEGTKSFTVTCFDPDAPTPSGFWHWVLVDLPADVTSLDAGAGAEGADLPGGAFMCRNDGGSHGFMGAAPPAGRPGAPLLLRRARGRPRRRLGVDADASPAVVSFNLAFKTAGRAHPARAPTSTERPHPHVVHTSPHGSAEEAVLYVAVALSSFRRYSTYTAATLAGIFTNSVFGVIISFAYIAVWKREPDAPAGTTSPTRSPTAGSPRR